MSEDFIRELRRIIFEPYAEEPDLPENRGVWVAIVIQQLNLKILAKEILKTL